jgi:hypothetical protein
MAQLGGADSSTDTAATEGQGGTGPGTGRVGTDGASVLEDAPPWLNRAGSLVAAGLILFAAAAWWSRALDLSNPCGARELSQAVCDEVPEFLQWLQFVLAIAGIAVAVLLAGLTIFQAVSGRRVPRIRQVAAVLAVLGVAWGVVFVVGWLVF